MRRFKDVEESIKNDKMRKKNITPVILAVKKEYPDMTLKELEFFTLGYKVAQRG